MSNDLTDAGGVFVFRRNSGVAPDDRECATNLTIPGRLILQMQLSIHFLPFCSVLAWS
jgi:hypothetical protein